MLRLQEQIPPDLTFAYLGAFCGFVAFQHCIGIGLAKKIYMSFGEGKGLGTVVSPQIAGAALAFNYVLHLLICVSVGGFTTGTAEARTGVSMSGNKAIIATMAAIWLWSKVFGDSPWLSKGFSLTIQWIIGVSGPE